MKNLYFSFLLLAFCINFTNTYSQLKYIDKVNHGMGGVEGIYYPNSITLSPDDKNLYIVSDYKSISVFKKDKFTEDLSFVDILTNGVNGNFDLNGIYEMDFSPDGLFAYGVVRNNNSVIVLRRDTATGILSEIQNITNTDTDNHLTAACGITVSKDGNNVYAVSRVTNVVIIFQRNQTTGKLKYLESVSTTLTTYSYNYGFFIISSNDLKYIYIGSYSDYAILTFSRNTLTGELSLIQKLDNINNFIRPKSFALSPDDRFLYAFNYNGIARFKVDSLNGSLSFVNNYDLSYYSGKLQTTLWPNSGVISKDSKNLYISLNYDNVVIKYSVNSENGSLTSDTIVYPDKNFIYVPDNSTGNRTIDISKDNKKIYVASNVQDNLTIIDNVINGIGLKVFREIIEGDNGFKLLSSPEDIKLTANQKFAFIASGSIMPY